MDRCRHDGIETPTQSFGDKKGRRPMQPISPTAANALPMTSGDASARKRPMEDVVYQAVTVAAILLVLGSLWIF